MSPYLRKLGRLLPALLLCVSGCAGIPESVRNLPDPEVDIELMGTPFYPQKRYQCGPAALATALVASGVQVSADDLLSKVYIPGRKGSLQVELQAATRTSGRIPYRLDSSLAAVVSELHAGRPVIVLQNLGVSMIPRWHYSVIVGIDGIDDLVVLRSGIEKRRLTPIKLFLRTWARGNFWAMAVLRPGEIPANANRKRYFAAVAAMEQAGKVEEATTGWRTALATWPGDPVAQFGLGNSLLSLNQPGDAERVYRDLLADNPDLAIARNNLAMTLLKQGRHKEAMLEIDTAIEQVDDRALIEELLDTKKQIYESLPATDL